MQVLPENRHSSRRLIIALALSTLLIASLLVVLPYPFTFPACAGPGCPEPAGKLQVVLEQRTADVLSEITLPEFEKRAVSAGLSEDTTRREIDAEAVAPALVSTENVIDHPQVNRDWYEIAREPVRQTIDEYFANEDTRKRLWQRTGSVMFRDTGEFDFGDPEPIIAAREFRRPLGVLGLGFTIGGCFIGIPLAGIPVEERGIGPNVIYCADIYE